MVEGAGREGGGGGCRRSESVRDVTSWKTGLVPVQSGPT